MQPVLAIPRPVGFPPCHRFGKSTVLMAVEFFCLVAADERLDVRLVLRAFDPSVL
ncbi:MAG TPA: hypothetical protein VMV76_04395 [Dehalococcoidia bacterium]|nr:hypothetical protein [Dehalococcoidia bacterium]